MNQPTLQNLPSSYYKNNKNDQHTWTKMKREKNEDKKLIIIQTEDLKKAWQFLEFYEHWL